MDPIVSWKLAESQTGAECSLALLTVPAPPVGDVEGQHDAIALLQQCHAIADLFDDAHVFVAKYKAAFGCGAALVHVQIRAADCWRSMISGLFWT